MWHIALSQGNLCPGHQRGQPLLDSQAIDILLDSDGECVGTRTKDSLNRISFCKFLENSILPTPKIRDVMSEPAIAGMNINCENVMPQNFVQTIGVKLFKVSSLRACLISNGCPYHVHSEGVRQIYPI